MSWEPPIGIEPMTYALRGARDLAAHALAAPIAPIIALMALTALGISGDPVHEPVHARSPCSLCSGRFGWQCCDFYPALEFSVSQRGAQACLGMLLQLSLRQSSRAHLRRARPTGPGREQRGRARAAERE